MPYSDEICYYEGVKYTLKESSILFYRKERGYIQKGEYYNNEDNNLELNNINIEWLNDEYKNHKNRRKENYISKEFYIITKKNNGIDNEYYFSKKFNDNPYFRKELCDRLIELDYSLNQLDYKKSKMYKLNKKYMPDHKVIQQPKWNEYKEGTGKTTPTPKTDLCIICDDKIITISLKSGKGRLTSADRYEFNAILKSVLNNVKYSNDKFLQKNVEDITKKMLSLEKHFSEDNYTTLCKKRDNNQYIDAKHIEWLEKLDNTCKECLKLWKIIKENNEEFIKDILFECASGELKFGNKVGRADWLIITEGSNSTEIKDIYRLNKRTNELDEYLKKCLPCDTSIFACKSSHNKLWCRFL